ncbi:hypothetical protein ABTP05_19395, partial [Acinetobacter baumannii]
CPITVTGVFCATAPVTAPETVGVLHTNLVSAGTKSVMGIVNPVPLQIVALFAAITATGL